MGKNEDLRRQTTKPPYVRSLRACLGAMLLLGMNACAPLTGVSGSTVTPSPLPTPPMPATPVAEQPAAGICAEPQGDTVTLTLRPDVPDPRCAVITGGQMLAIANATDFDIEAGLGPHAFRLAAGETITLRNPVESYLAPGGVHYLQIHTPGVGSPAIWFKKQ